MSASPSSSSSPLVDPASPNAAHVPENVRLERLQQFRRCRVAAYESGGLAFLAGGAVTYLAYISLVNRFPLLSRVRFAAITAGGGTLGALAAVQAARECQQELLAQLQQAKADKFLESIEGQGK